MHLQVDLKASEYHGKVKFFICSRFIKHTIKYFKFNVFCFNLNDYGLHLMKIKNPVSQNIRIEHKTNQKKKKDCKH